MRAEAALGGGERPPDRTAGRAIRFRDGLVVVLALTTGAVDAVTFLRLGKVFSSVITGNLALLGVAAGKQDAGLAENAGLALAGYALGVLAGGALAGTAAERQPVWPCRVTVTLAAELLLLAGFGGGWVTLSGRPSGGPRLVLLAVLAAGMGMQSTAVRRLGRMSTTYLTSTLTGLLEALAVRRRPKASLRSAGILAAFVAGATAGAAAASLDPALVPVAVMVPVALVVIGSVPAAACRAEPGHSFLVVIRCIIGGRRRHPVLPSARAGDGSAAGALQGAHRV